MQRLNRNLLKFLKKICPGFFILYLSSVSDEKSESSLARIFKDFSVG